MSAEFFNWRHNNKTRTLPRGKKLRLLSLGQVIVRWSFDNWQTSRDSESSESGWDLQHTDLPTETLAAGRQITFTFFVKNAARWEGQDYQMIVE